ncbi:hypothetical protein [Fundidesulfovibrio agrisoli]|uniref:hypothetical protein n=1 Tax=Fundidesulfovibrio agrisoli TaxID=2922717 RepID=UPI001FAB8F84|nr:hypothetical protein [Fundidesulfovibrio agrisoli]
MSNDVFYYDFKELEEVDEEGLKRFISTCGKKRLQSITVLDLAYFDGLSTNGVYMFFDSNDNVIYVGKCTGRCFVERIPSHFDIRCEHNMFGTLMNKYVAVNGVSVQCALKSAREFSLTVLCCDINLNIKEIERYMQHVLRPALNSIKSKSPFKHYTTLGAVANVPKSEEGAINKPSAKKSK